MIAHESAPDAATVLRHRVETVRERLRFKMLEQETTGRRETYSDGFAMGLCHAISELDRIIRLSYGAMAEASDSAPRAEGIAQPHPPYTQPPNPIIPP